MYVDVVIPLKFKESVTYSVPQEMEGKIVPGKIVNVNLQKVRCNAVVIRVSDRPSYDSGKIRPINGIVNLPPVAPKNMEFMLLIARYYMCSLNDVFRFAAPSTTRALKREKETEEKELPDISELPLPSLTGEQQTAFRQIVSFLSQNKTVLLNGVTGSGKTEIYIRLAAQCLSDGKNMLYLVPEMAICRQIQLRLKKVFGERLLVYHSGKTAQKRREVYEKIATGKGPYLILGLRSALFLPFSGLGAVVVDEEHDSSYKQNEPAPRYNGRDTALLLGKVMDCPVLLGSATPSFESVFNVRAGKFAQVNLEHKFFGDSRCRITVVDMVRERKKNAVRGSLSLTLIRAIRERLERGEQCIVFRSRRAYATYLECPECGHVPRCPKCNLPLAYHRNDGRLRCHICGWTVPAVQTCPECGQGELQLFGAGTEKIEEELATLFPEARIDRFDSDSSRNRTEMDAILTRFADRETDILVGTQMIAKGFDFDRLTLTAVIKAESLSSLFDFRADEKAVQLLRQLQGRAGRRGNDCEMIIQTTRAEHPVFGLLHTPGTEISEELLDERKEFNYPPYVRLIRITVHDADREKLERLAAQAKEAIVRSGIEEFEGPVAPPLEKMDGEYQLQFILRLSRSRNHTELKSRLYERLKYIPGKSCVIDVDPINI